MHSCKAGCMSPFHRSVAASKSYLASACWMQAGSAKPAPFADCAIVRTAARLAQSPRATRLQLRRAAIAVSSALRSASTRSSLPVASSTA